MVWYRRLKFPSFRRDSRIWQSGYSISRSKAATFNGFSSFSSISQRGVRVHGVNRNFNNPFLSGSRRFYNVKLFNSTEFKDIFVQALVITSGIVLFIPLYYGYWEKVPYTNRTHWTMERRLGETALERIKVEFKGQILPPTHPESVRVRMIAKDIIGALQRGLGKENVLAEENGREARHVWAENEGKWHREDEILDDKWVQKSRKKGQKQGKEPNTSHLDGLYWEVLVVNEPLVKAVCLPGGKIVVFTGLLEYFKSDAEIATIIGHEVGHAVARHRAEGFTNNSWFCVTRLILHQFGFDHALFDRISSLLLTWVPFLRRMEMEADYIGLLLIASAGYNPRVAPEVYEKLGRVTSDSNYISYSSEKEREEMLTQAKIMEKALRSYIFTHPSGKERAELLEQAKIMEEAVTIYSSRY